MNPVAYAYNYYTDTLLSPSIYNQTQVFTDCNGGVNILDGIVIPYNTKVWRDKTLANKLTTSIGR